MTIIENHVNFSRVNWLRYGLVCCTCAWAGLIAPAADWPFYPPNNSPPPSIESKWIRNGIDAFVWQKLNENGLQPAPAQTDKGLVRRLYFDLIGLPPNPDDFRRFMDDQSDSRWDNLVDQLLDDPRYGERWARLWLDLARYADTAGYEGDPDLPHAWRYRDYVIDAFTNDKPYDLFIKEQIAGDEFDDVMGAGELPNTPAEKVVALTFLRLAPFTEPRGNETRHEMLSEITSTVGSVFLGLTVGCAKCHDHKHDRISTKDFYRMKAFFATVSMPQPERGDVYQIGGPIAASFYRDGEKRWADQQRHRFEREITESLAQLKQLRAELTERLGCTTGFGLQAMGGSAGHDCVYSGSRVDDGRLHQSLVNCDGTEWTFFTDNIPEPKIGTVAGSNRGRWFGDLASPRHITLGQYSGITQPTVSSKPHTGAFAQILIYDHALNKSERSQLNEWLDKSSPGIVTGPPPSGLRVWFDAEDLDADPATNNPSAGSRVAAWTDRVNGITLGQNVPERQPVVAIVGHKSKTRTGIRFDDDFLTGRLSDTGLIQDQHGSLVVVYTAEQSGEGYGVTIGDDGEFISTFVNLAAAQDQNLETALAKAESELVSADQRKRLRWLSDRERMLKQQIKRLQPLAMSLRHSYGPPFEPGVPTSRILIRGEYDNPGEVVEPGFLSCMTGHENPASIRLDPFKRWPTRSRRMALAEWIASADNSLTARVMANRLWHWHFGRGIVRTPSDFGQLSGGPSHPELLDWLALQFVKENWSIKAVHRLIVTSATYQQTSLHQNRRAEQIDPDNTLLWRFRRQRLDAETIRDAVLSVSGRLNPEQYGLPIFPPLPDDIEQRVKYSQNKWDTQYGLEGRKRSIYVYQQRTLTMPFMQVFDALVCDESRPKRRHSVTPLQALAMYNGRLVNEEAHYFADRVLENVGADADATAQIELAFQIALGRLPTDDEIHTMRVPMDGSPSGLESVCRILLNSNEFVFID